MDTHEKMCGILIRLVRQRNRSVSTSDPRTRDKVLVKYQNLNQGRQLDQEKGKRQSHFSKGNEVTFDTKKLFITKLIS